MAPTGGVRMFEQHFLSSSSAVPASSWADADSSAGSSAASAGAGSSGSAGSSAGPAGFSAGDEVVGPLEGGERPMWRGRCGVAEYAFDEAASMPRWTLPEATDVLVTDRRVIYAHRPQDGERVRSGELRWLWPQHLRVQPGARSDDRGAAATQIQLVCGGADGSFPALVFAGGDLATAGDADRVANMIRQSITRFRIDNAGRLGIDANQVRMLSRLLIGPEFRNHQGGEGQTVSILGSLLVNRPAAAPEPTLLDRAESTRLINYRPGRAADAARAIMAERAEQEAQLVEPDIASRAADLAARVANMVSSAVPPPAPSSSPAPAPSPASLPSSPESVSEPDDDGPTAVVIELPLRMPLHSEPRSGEAPARNLGDLPTTNLAARAESMRRTAARMAANSGRGRIGSRRAPDQEPGITGRGNRDR
ncbi:translation initiation factor 2 [Actinoplanes sp. NPDC051470]|uniref:translation initiation factor 2 n=1 Tax=Actinoplanes sp. NPDC051470 TaxID=3157224 RepID=UPI003414C619